MLTDKLLDNLNKLIVIAEQECTCHQDRRVCEACLAEVELSTIVHQVEAELKQVCENE